MNKKEIKNSVILKSLCSGSQPLTKKQRGPEQQHLRTTHCAAFTLIELLVVVLIIGILSAVALPQYQVAVQKAKLVRLVPLVDGLYTAEESYFLANGEYTTDLSNLDITVGESCSFPAQHYYNCIDYWVGVWGTNTQAILVDKNGDVLLSYLRFFQDDEVNGASKGDIACFSNGKVSRQVCRNLGGGTESANPYSNWEYQYLIPNK